MLLELSLLPSLPLFGYEACPCRRAHSCTHTTVVTDVRSDVDVSGVLQAGIAHVLRAQAAAPQGQLAADVDTAQHAIGMRCAEPHPKGSTATDDCKPTRVFLLFYLCILFSLSLLWAFIC